MISIWGPSGPNCEFDHLSLLNMVLADSQPDKMFDDEFCTRYTTRRARASIFDKSLVKIT